MTYGICIPPQGTRTLEPKVFYVILLHDGSGQGGRTLITDVILWQHHNKNEGFRGVCVFKILPLLHAGDKK